MLIKKHHNFNFSLSILQFQCFCVQGDIIILALPSLLFYGQPPVYMHCCGPTVDWEWPTETCETTGTGAGFKMQQAYLTSQLLYPFCKPSCCVRNLNVLSTSLAFHCFPLISVQYEKSISRLLKPEMCWLLSVLSDFFEINFFMTVYVFNSLCNLLEIKISFSR